MKKSLKITLIILGVLVSVILLDTLQAKIFNNSPLLKIRQNLDGGNTDYIDKGLLVNHYLCNNKDNKTVWKNTKYACPMINNYEELSLDDLYNLELTKDKDIRKIDFKYSLEDAQEDNCLVIKHPNLSINNESVSETFLENYNNKQDAFMRIASNTVEGDIILTDIIYLKSTDKIYLVVDSTRDNFSNNSIDLKEYTHLKVNDTNWVLYNDDSSNSYTINYIFKNLNCLKSQIESYITTEVITPKEITLNELIKNNNFEDINYAYVLKNSSNNIALIINTTNQETISKLEQVLTKNYKKLQKAQIPENYYVYVDNGSNDFSITEDLDKCVK